MGKVSDQYVCPVCNYLYNHGVLHTGVALNLSIPFHCPVNDNRSETYKNLTYSTEVYWRSLALYFYNAYRRAMALCAIMTIGGHWPFISTMPIGGQWPLLLLCLLAVIGPYYYYVYWHCLY